MVLTEETQTATPDRIIEYMYMYPAASSPQSDHAKCRAFRLTLHDAWPHISCHTPHKQEAFT